MAILDTQREAWEDIQKKLPKSRREVLLVVARYGAFGATTMTISRDLAWPINCVSGRVTELVDAGLIKDSGRRAVNPSGKKAVLWVVV